MEKIGVIGAGAWGTALALVCARAGRQVRLWARNPETADQIGQERENRAYLPGRILPQTVQCSADPASLAGVDLLLYVAPAQSLRSLSSLFAPLVRKGREGEELPPFVVCAKGIEQDDGSGQAGKLPGDVLKETFPEASLAILSGPTFATEVADDKPAAVTLACQDSTLGERIAGAIGTRHFRPYWTDDVISVQIGGALKNVMAIACGIVEGKGLGENARAALVTRGLAEIARYTRFRGGNPGTLMGLAGLGDLTLTATSTLSRNYSLGHALGCGQAVEDIMAGRKTVAEGMFTARAMVLQAEAGSLDMPVTRAVNAIVNESADIDATVADLLDRPFRREDL